MESQGEGEGFRFRHARDVELTKVGLHLRVTERRLLRDASFARFADNAHHQARLLAEVAHWSVDLDHGRRAEEALLVAVRLLSDCEVGLG